MGRSIVTDERVEAKINELIISSYTQKNSSVVGLLFGQHTPTKDYVLHMSKTPQVDTPTMQEEDGVTGDGQNIKSQTVTLKSVDDKWVASHAQQSLRMLPGGLTVLGIFVVASPEEIKPVMHKLKQVVYSVSKAVKRMSMKEDEGKEFSQKILLLIHPGNKKLVSKTYDTSDPKNEASPAEWKYQHLTQQFVALESKLAINLSFPIPKDISSQSIYKQIKYGLRPFCDNIYNSLVLVNNQLYSDEELLIPTESSSKKDKAKKGKSDNKSLKRTVRLLSKYGTVEDQSEPSIFECKGKMYIRGSICGRATAHQKSTVKEAVMCIKEDFVRSLLSRCELLCDDLLTEEVSDPKLLYETPKKVLASIPGTTLPVCDYLFPDESFSDSIQRFKELLDIDLSEENLLECEHYPTEEELLLPMKNLSESNESIYKNTPPPKQAQHNGTMIGLILAGVIGTASAAMAYFYSDLLS